MSEENDQEKAEEAIREILQSVQESNEVWPPDALLHYGPSRRNIAFWGDVTNESVLPTISQLIELEHRSKKPIRLHLNTDGGSLTAALALYDIMKMIDSEIYVTTTGMCASAGLIILAGGTKRFCTPHARFFYHQPVLHSGPEIISGEQMSQVSGAYQNSQITYDKILKEEFNISETTWNQEFKSKISKYFSADDALNYNVVDGIIK